MKSENLKQLRQFNKLWRLNTPEGRVYISQSTGFPSTPPSLLNKADACGTLFWVVFVSGETKLEQNYYSCLAFATRVRVAIAIGSTMRCVLRFYLDRYLTTLPHTFSTHDESNRGACNKKGNRANCNAIKQFEKDRAGIGYIL